jgi:hypothetical protein
LVGGFGSTKTGEKVEYDGRILGGGEFVSDIVYISAILEI